MKDYAEDWINKGFIQPKEEEPEEQDIEPDEADLAALEEEEIWEEEDEDEDFDDDECEIGQLGWRGVASRFQDMGIDYDE